MTFMRFFCSAFRALLCHLIQIGYRIRSDAAQLRRESQREEKAEWSENLCRGANKETTMAAISADR